MYYNIAAARAVDREFNHKFGSNLRLLTMIFDYDYRSVSISVSAGELAWALLGKPQHALARNGNQP